MAKVDEIIKSCFYIDDGATSYDTIADENKRKQALYKDLYEIISFSADRGEAYKKLKDYFGETND